MTTYLKRNSLGRAGRLAVLTAVLATFAVPGAAPAAVRAAGPQRSGTIHGGVGDTPITPGVRGAEGCVGAPACSAWLQSGCVPHLTGANPALQAAIVDVGGLADNRERTLDLARGTVVFGARYTVQFWTSSYDPSWGYGCKEILDRRFVAGWDCIRTTSCRFRIPPHARWMTIAASPENLTTQWTLR